MNKKFMINILLVPIFILTGCNGEVSKLGYKQISSQDVVEMMAEETNYIILDVRTPEEYNSGHIANSINIANETIGSSEIKELPNKEQLIMIYCRSGNRSKQASQKLAQLGYTNIVEFGGINTWTGELVTD